MKNFTQIIEKSDADKICEAIRNEGKRICAIVFVGFFVVILLIALSGCTTTKVTSPSGVVFEHTNFLKDTDFKTVEIDPVTGKCVVDGYETTHNKEDVVTFKDALIGVVGLLVGIIL